jgi:Flp pilus assembly protein TadD
VAEREARLSLEEGGGEYARSELANIAVGFAQRGEAGKARHVATTLGPDAHRAWAYVALAENDLDRATRELEAAGKVPVEDWLTLAAHEALSGRRDQARQAFARALALDPNVKARVANDPLLGPLVR